MDSKLKQIAMLAAADRERREAFQASLLEAARTMDTGSVARLVVNHVDHPPAGLPYRPAAELDTGDGLPAYDAVVEITGPAAETTPLLDRIARKVAVGVHHSFCVEEHLEKDEQPAMPGERSPGIKYMGRLMFHADLPDSAALRSWALHVPLALRVHRGASKYVRNWVIGRAGDGVPDTRGISELHFRSVDDLLRRFFDSDHGKAEVLHDLAHFVASGNRLYCSEYVVKG